MIAQLSPNAAIGLWLTFSNVGTSTGVIESIFVLLREVSCDSIISFPTFNEGFNHIDLKPVPAPERPVLPFAIKAGESVQKKILFATPIDGFKFVENSKYILSLYIQMADQQRAIQCTKKELIIVEKLEAGRVNASMVPLAIDKPIEIPVGKPELNYWEII
jgi:hypothetical protein